MNTLVFVNASIAFSENFFSSSLLVNLPPCQWSPNPTP